MSPVEHYRQRERRLEGIPLSPGIAIGRPCFFATQRDVRHASSSLDVIDETTRLCASLQRIADQRATLADETAAVLGPEHAEIFHAQRLMLDDVYLQEQLVQTIEADGCSAAEAVWRVLERYRSQLAASDSAYLRERADDVGEIRQALIGDLDRARSCRHCHETDFCTIDHCHLGNDHILIGSEISASLPIETDRHTIGFVVDKAGPHCHAVILARALHRPVVGSIRDLPDAIPLNSQLLIDGDEGTVIVNPSSSTLQHYRTTRVQDNPKIESTEPVDGFRVMANISVSADIDRALAAGAEGVGLYRTEMEMLAAGRPLGEDEQTVRYTKVIKAMAARPVYIRLVDFGHDKHAEWTGLPRPAATASHDDEHTLLRYPDLLRTQARALARASVHGTVHVVYPMISSIEQFKALRGLFGDATADLATDGLRHGVLFELPAACLEAARFMQMIDFGCIGTNDLTHYLFGVDRASGDAVGDRRLYDDAVLWELIDQLAHAATSAGKTMMICGELAGDPKFTPRIMRSGISATSTNPANIAAVRRSATQHTR
ncbi:MAG: phosphoenolpyruvate-utilizing N-terminal domain-containing protein [Gammaproteobacteria bacterium]|nr:phosphoenolpyruvate-utilizing N-terminal domain-containing protein [Gammaproteobacteria bacterium]